MDKEYVLVCSACDEDFTVISHSGGVPEICTFCGADLDNDKDDDDYEDDED